jgi:acetolactate synthase-1/2/3 large subunit
LLSQAEHPVFLLGSQVVLHPHHVAGLLVALENLGVPVFLSGMSRGLLSNGHPLLFRHKKKDALRKADLVFLFGVPLDFRLDYGREINHKAVQVAVNRSAADMERNRKPELEIVGDPATYLIELGNEEGIDANKDRWGEWLETLRATESEQEAMIEEVAAEPTDYVNPLFLCQEINKKQEYNSIIVGDGGDFVATASYIVQPMGPLMWLDPGPFGTLGVGAGFALAAKLVEPDKEVWILYGDGAVGYSLIEFDTFVRHNIPIISVVGNDAGWTQITRDQVEILQSDVGTTLRYADYHKVAEAFGGKGFLIQDAAEVAEVLQEAKAAAAAGSPVLVNALIGKTDFRRGASSM